MCSDQLKLIGDLLRETREKKGIELRFVSQKTRINYKILQNIESNNVEALPNKTYVKGFVQICAKELGLDVDIAIESYEYTYNRYENPEQYKSTTIDIAEDVQHQEDDLNQEPIAKQQSYNKNRRLMIGSAAILILIVGIFAFNSSEKRDSTSQQIAHILKSPEPTATVDLPQKEEEAKELEPTIVKIDSAQKDSPAVEPTVQPTPAQEAPLDEEVSSKNDKAIKLRKIPSNYKLYSVVADAPENSDTSLLPTHIKKRLIADKENIYINAIAGDTWLSHKKDDDPIKKFVLRQGRTLSLRGEEILLFLGNVNATKIFYNNQLINAPSKSGVKTLIFPERLKNDHYFPIFVQDKKGEFITDLEYLKRLSQE